MHVAIYDDYIWAMLYSIYELHLRWQKNLSGISNGWLNDPSPKCSTTCCFVYLYDQEVVAWHDTLHHHHCSNSNILSLASTSSTVKYLWPPPTPSIVQNLSCNKFQTVTFEKRTEELVALFKNLKKDNRFKQNEAFHVPAFFHHLALFEDGAIIGHLEPLTDPVE